jgi:molecular chaperone GrpE
VIETDKKKNEAHTSKSGEIQPHTQSAPAEVPAGIKSQQADSVEKTEEEPLEKALKEASDNRDRWLRATAELENFKKRSAQDRSRYIKYRNEELLRDLLPVQDNLERAIKASSRTEQSSTVIDGVKMVAGMLNEVMERHGVKEIEAMGKPFDPQFHEAIARLPDPSKAPNTVMDEMEKGYMYHDRLLRPSRVVVSEKVNVEE